MDYKTLANKTEVMLYRFTLIMLVLNFILHFVVKYMVSRGIQ